MKLTVIADLNNLDTHNARKGAILHYDPLEPVILGTVSSTSEEVDALTYGWLTGGADLIGFRFDRPK
jgi:hypothetical protein